MVGTKGQHPTDVRFQTKYILVILPKSSCGVQMEHRSTKSTLFPPCYRLGRIYGRLFFFFFFGDCVICEAECGALPRRTGQGLQLSGTEALNQKPMDCHKRRSAASFSCFKSRGSEPAGATFDPEMITSVHLYRTGT